MRFLKIAQVATLLLIVSPTTVVCSESCEKQKAKFAELNSSLVFRTETDWKRFNQKQFDAQTESAHRYLRDQMISELDGGKSDSQSIERFLRCVLSLPEYQVFREESNTPKAYSIGPTAIAVGYYIYRGGNAVPDTRPYLEVYQKGQNGGWKWIGEVGETYRRSTFFVHPLTPAVPEQFWFLLSGFEIGDNGTRLHLEIISFDGKMLRSIWAKSGLALTTLSEVHPNYIVLSEYKGSHEGHDVYDKEVFDVVASGLRKRPTEVREQSSNPHAN